MIKKIGRNSFELEEYDAEKGLRQARLIVYGDPHGQGAISYNTQGVGRYSNSEVLEPWRDAIKTTAILGTRGHVPVAPPRRRRAPGAPPLSRKRAKGPALCLACKKPRRDHGIFAGAVNLRAVVTFARRNGDEEALYPIDREYGDWDHHGRAAGDPITGTVITDDCNVVEGQAIKTFPAPDGHHSEALDRPGIVLTVWELAT